MLALNASWTKGFIRKGDALKAAGRAREALDVYKQGLEANPKCGDLQERAATAEAQLAMLEEEERERARAQATEAAMRHAEEERKRLCDEAKVRLAQQRHRERNTVKQARQRQQRRMMQVREGAREREGKVAGGQ